MFDKNIDHFLKPIDNQFPFGIDLKSSDKFSALRDLRIELQSNETENNSEWSFKKKGANYDTLVDMCENILKSVSKDLMVTIYYIEALFKTDSLQGLLHGLQVFNALCENYWENLYPQFTTDDYEFRTLPFKLLQSSLFKMMSSFAIVNEKDEKILLSQLIDEQNVTKINAIKLKIENYIFKQSYKDIEIYTETLNKIIEAIEKTNEFVELIPHDDIDLFLCEKYFKQCLKMYQNALDKQKTNEIVQEDNALNIIKQISLQVENLTPPIHTPENKQSISIIAQENLNEIEIKSREEAYLAIEKSIQFLLTQDPQAIVPNMIQKTLGYRHLSLHQIFNELFEICNGQNSFVKLFQNSDNK
jgi:type VI secretion system protein ImpA